MESPWSPLQLVENATVPAILLVTYFFGCGINIANYVGYFRYHGDVYGDSLPRAYLAFVIIGTGTYVFFSGTMWLWAAKYSATREERASKLQNGIWAIFFLKDLPLFITEYHAILCCGWLNGYQGFAFIFQLLCALFSFSFTWLSITWRGSEWLQASFGGPQGLKTGTERVVMFSPPPVQKFSSPPHSAAMGGAEWSALRAGRENTMGYEPPIIPLRAEAAYHRPTAASTPRDLDAYHRERFHAEMEMQAEGGAGSHHSSPGRFLVVPVQQDPHSPSQHFPPSGQRGAASGYSPSNAAHVFSPQEGGRSPHRGHPADIRRSPSGSGVLVERHVF